MRHTHRQLEQVRQPVSTLPRSLAFALLLAALAFATVRAQSTTTLVQMRDLTPHELRSDAFVLSTPQELRIEAVGADGEWSSRGRGFIERLVDKDDDGRGYWRGNAWILDASSRRVVWELERAETRGNRDGIHKFDGTIRLPAGSYEVFFASYSAMSWSSDGFNLIRIFDGKREGRRNYDDDGLSEDFKLTIQGAGRRASAEEITRLRADAMRGAFVSLTGARSEDSKRVGFALTRPTEVEIYALGEARDRSTFDYGWIIDADTRQKIWRFDFDGSDPAGGAAKNRVARVRRTLPAGRYAAFYVTDDSHDPTDWNSAPPHDPIFYGLTIRATNEADRASVTTFDYENVPVKDAIVAITRVRDDETRSAGFTLTRPLDVRVYALGEGSGRNMADHGWIVNTATHRRVWEMEYDDTQHAGGAEKNRVADATVRLEPGSYMVYYVTDGSHSYRDWNSAAPMDGELWGITVVPAKGQAESGVVTPYVETVDAAVVAQIVRVRDDERERKPFTLDRDTDLQVYALGEASGRDLVDYAWIEERRTGRAVWEMTYRNTRHAGGARKNRVFDETIHLPAGEYVLRYETDDSHSFGDWNDAPPDDPAHWGVTVRRVTK